MVANKLKTLLFIPLCIVAFCCNANGLRLQFISQNHQVGNQTINLSVNWENCWQNDYNYDGVWFFGKYKGVDSVWHHLNTTDYQLITSDAMLNLVTAKDGGGYYITPSAKGQFKNIGGKITAKLKSTNTDLYDVVRFYALELVYVPKGKFYLGDSASNRTLAQDITSKSLKLDSLTSKVFDTYDGNYYNINNDYPSGYAAFWLLKYEISQQQWVDFLNCLTARQLSAHVMGNAPFSNGVRLYADNVASRNGIVFGNKITASIDGSFSDTTSGGSVAANFLNFDDLAAYLDWAALRPISELEFEKACRGPNISVPKEFSWGSTTAIKANSVKYINTTSEGVKDKGTAQSGLANYLLPIEASALMSPLRVGFGLTDSTDRVSGGVGYCGAADLSGNVWEQCISVACTTFNSQNGDGVLLASGLSNEKSWPKAAANSKVILKGGGYMSLIFNDLQYVFRDLAVSDRFYSNTDVTKRRNTTGGRGGRTP